MKRPKVLVTCRWPEAVEGAISEDFDVEIIDLNGEVGTDTTGVADWLSKYEYICPTITDRFDESVLSRVPLRTKALCNFGAGLNHIDLDACKANSIIVTNTPDVLTEDTADVAIMLALMAARRAGEGERLVRSQAWRGWAPTQMLGSSLSGKVLGLVGFGRIGRAMARKAHHAFGMHVVYHSRTAEPATDPSYPARWLPLDDLVATADVISLHVPGGAETRNIISAKRISLMKPRSILINTARGDLIDETALAAALQDRRIAAAGLDVFDGEPKILPALLDLQNIVLLPHLGSATTETRTAMGLRALANLRAIVAGDDPPDRVV